MYTLLLVVNVIAAIVMVVVILLQHGRGADMGTSFGRGSQGSLVGVTGSANFLSKTTSVLATIFFASALALGIVTQSQETDAVLDELTRADEAAPAVQDAPAAADEEVPAVTDEPEEGEK